MALDGYGRELGQSHRLRRPYAGSAAERADQPPARGGGRLDRRGRGSGAGVAADVRLALEGIDGDPVMVRWATRRARAGVGGLARVIAALTDTRWERAFGQLGAGGVDADDHPVHVG